MKKKIIIGNWKMNPKTIDEAQKLFLVMEAKARKAGRVEVVVCPPVPFLSQLSRFSKKISLGVQNCSFLKEGAFTGEVSASMIRSVGASYVLLGHSERKKYFKETREQVALKTAIALGAGLDVVLCVETPGELKTILERGGIEVQKHIVVAYEPSSAISTEGGKSMPVAKIKKTIDALRQIVGFDTSVLYGGSVGSNTAGEILFQGGVDGVLVGAASLKPQEFLDIVEQAEIL